MLSNKSVVLKKKKKKRSNETCGKKSQDMSLYWWFSFSKERKKKETDEIYDIDLTILPCLFEIVSQGLVLSLILFIKIYQVILFNMHHSRLSY